MLSRTKKRTRVGAALGSRTFELGSGTPWAEADRGRELEQCGNKRRDRGLGFVGSPARSVHTHKGTIYKLGGVHYKDYTSVQSVPRSLKHNLEMSMHLTGLDNSTNGVWTRKNIKSQRTMSNQKDVLSFLLVACAKKTIRGNNETPTP
ncbi:hypothetical protein F2Q69_00042089 [Brassica cretica]|uniref:Uncharacterized protein n=1 Tax=Brassica cretica TaxID=69181 RepID=A0A8S9NH82_BRACR|nr:hypothetical protein F2Q69_00042089 [Brassica cretica]